MLEGIHITRLGFLNRTIYSGFVKRYYPLVPDVPRNPQDPKPAAASILKDVSRSLRASTALVWPKAVPSSRSRSVSPQWLRGFGAEVSRTKLHPPFFLLQMFAHLILHTRYQDEVTQRSELNKLKNQLDRKLKWTGAQLESEVERRSVLEGMYLSQLLHSDLLPPSTLFLIFGIGIQKKLEAVLAAETATFEEETPSRRLRRPSSNNNVISLTSSTTRRRTRGVVGELARG